jgi:hypothetical protein
MTSEVSRFREHMTNCKQQAQLFSYLKHKESQAEPIVQREYPLLQGSKEQPVLEGGQGKGKELLHVKTFDGKEAAAVQ